MTTTVIEFHRPPNAKGPSRTVVKDEVLPSGTPTSDPAIDIRHMEGNLAYEIIEIDKLFPQEQIVKPDLLKALRLLGESVTFLELGVKSITQNDLVTADRSLQRLQFLLLDLFSCRSVGDGFGLIINTLHFALINQKAQPLSRPQFLTVTRVVKELRSHPFMDLYAAINQVQELESVGFEVDPPIISDLFVEVDE